MPSSPHHDGGASPVVGMILVLAISAAATTAILVWGLPAIGEMRADVEHQSVLTEFREFDTDIKELVRASASKTAKMWHFSQSQGEFSVLAKSERWTFAADALTQKGNAVVYNTTVYEMDDTNNSFVIANYGNTYKTYVNADLIDGSTPVPLKVEVTTEGGACPATFTNIQDTAGTTFPGKLDGSAPGTLRVCLYGTDTQPVNLENNLVQVEVRYQAADVGKRETATWIWIGDVGRAQWTISSTGGIREVYHTNGMLLHGSGTGLSLDGNPTVSPPKEHAGEWRFFARMVSLRGGAALGGEGTIPVLLNLYGGKTLADEFTATHVKVWTHGELADTWDDFFLTSSYGYECTLQVEEAAGAPAGEDFLMWTNATHQANGMKLILHHSAVTVGS